MCLADGVIEKPNWDHDYYIKETQLLMAHYGDKGHWQNCRELFHEEKDHDTTYRFFVRPTLPIKEIAAFIRRLETTLNIKPRSEVQQARYKIKSSKDGVDSPSTGKPVVKKKELEFTVFDDAVCITPSPFWIEHPLKLSFLTAAIKMVDYEEVICYKRMKTGADLAEYLIDIDDDQDYFRPTQFATRRFLAGYTQVNRSRKKDCGWVDVFEVSEVDSADDGRGPKSQEKAVRILTLPDGMESVEPVVEKKKPRMFGIFYKPLG